MQAPIFVGHLERIYTVSFGGVPFKAEVIDNYYHSG